MNQSLDAMLIIELIIFVVVKRITEVKQMNRKPKKSRQRPKKFKIYIRDFRGGSAIAHMHAGTRTQARAHGYIESD